MTPSYSHNGLPVSSEVFYAIACDPRRSVAVEACAGAGKTWMLVSRMLRALLEGDGDVEPHEILAITFTKKAAGEMRERLYEWLERFARADDDTLRRELVMRGVLSQKQPGAPREMREKLSGLYLRVLANGRPVQIRTFHSWFAALLRSAPMAALQQLGLPVNYELLEDDKPATDLVWRRFYAAVAADASLKADFEAVVMAHGRFQAGKALQGALDKRTEFALADAAGLVDTSVQHFCLQFPECAGLDHPDVYFRSGPCRAVLAAAAAALGRASAATFSAKGAELERALADGHLQDALGALLTKGAARKFSDKVPGLAAVRQAQELALRLAAMHQQHEAWEHQQRMARLSRALLAEFAALKRARGWVDMNDVERAAQVMLSDAVLSGWVQQRLDARIKHLLIDEFQDTNPLQWQALHAWLSGYAGAGSGDAPSVFIVGDPKQSIYRFRRAEPQVFRAARAFVVDGLGGELLECDHTQRNSLAVIDAVNAALGEARDHDGFDGFRAHTTASGIAGSVIRLPQVARGQQADGDEGAEGEGAGAAEASWRDSLTTPRLLPEETLPTLEARQAAAWIAGQLAAVEGPSGPLQASDIMVLSRRRAGLLPLQDELRALHIAAQVGEKTELIDCCEVQDIVALLDVLVSPQHDLSLARALRSPLFGFGDAALVELALARDKAGNERLSWFDVLQKEEPLRPEFIGLAGIFIQYKGWVDSLPPHDALQAIYSAGDVLARFGAAAPAGSRNAVLANLRALLNVALQIDGGRYATPYAFVRALKAGGLQAPAAVNTSAVRLLTVHGAKGLEAKAVLLLDTDTAERNADSMSVLVDWPGEAPGPHKFVFLVSESRPPACAAVALEAEQAARRREELNALYVALTRARQTLVVSSIQPHRAAPQSWWQRLLPHAFEAAPISPPAPSPAAQAREGDAGPAVFHLPALPVLPASARLAAPEAGPLAEDSTEARVGQAMHRLLEWGGSLPEAQVRAVAREFRLEAAQAARAVALARQIVEGEGAWAWDARVLAWQGDEVALAGQGGLMRLDRLVQRRDAGHEGQWWILDYKSSHAPERLPELVARMKDYQAAVQAVYPGSVVRAAFLTGQGTVVEVL